MRTAASRFPTTRHSAILATRSENAGERRAAWDAVIAAYWKPAYKYIRLRWNRQPADAEDLVQSFFARVLEKEFFARYDAAKGSFRTYFRTCLDGYMANQVQFESRAKRGGGAIAVPLDFAGAEEELVRSSAVAQLAPEECFHREWQRQVFGMAVDDLRRECEGAGRSLAFAIFSRYDLAEERSSYDALADEFGIPPTTVTNHLASMRRALRRLVLARLREQTADEREFHRETRALLGRG